MKRDDFVPVAQIRGWIRSLCEQNRLELIPVCQQKRIAILQRTADFSAELIDLSETYDDRSSAERFYVGAFWRFACDAIGAKGVKTALLVISANTIVETPDWVFDCSKRNGNDPAKYAPRRYFQHIDKEELKIVTPSELIDPSAKGRGVTESYFDAVRIYNEKRRLAGAQWLWPKGSLPTIEQLAPYVHLPADFVPKRPIFGLDRSSQINQLKPETPPKLSDDVRMFCEKHGYIRKPEGLPFKVLCANFVALFSVYNTTSDATVRRAFYRYWKTKAN